MALLSRATIRPASKTQKIRLEAVKPPSLARRVGQVAAGVLVVHCMAAFFAVSAIFVLDLMDAEPLALASKQPGLASGLATGIPLLAVILGVSLSLRGVYLAQLVGLAVGILSTVAILLERQFLGWAPTLADFAALPIAGAGSGFLAGFLVTGKLVELPEFEYKPIDSWDREAKPSYRELSPNVHLRWKKVFYGYIAGNLSASIIHWILRLILSPVFHHNPRSVDVAMERYAFPVQALSLLIAGFVAGSDTKTGTIQGIAVGLALSASDLVRNRPESTEAGLARMASVLVITAIGGVIGRRLFHPYRVYGNALDASSQHR